MPTFIAAKLNWFTVWSPSFENRSFEYMLQNQCDNTCINCIDLFMGSRTIFLLNINALAFSKAEI